MTKNVFIEGDKLGFNSKNAVEKFKACVKTDDNTSISVLKEKYIKIDYNLELIEKNDTDIKFKLSKHVVKEVNKKDMLKAKLKSMRDSRTNADMHKARSNKDIPEDIMEEYIKLKKTVNMPIPEPGEILANPEQYKPMISMVMGNDMMKQLGSNHPYTRYFKLLATKLGVETSGLPIPTKDYNELLKPTEIENIKGNIIGEYETDSETNSDSDTN